MSNEAMTTEELKAMEEAMAAFLEEFRNPSRCDGANLRAGVFPEKYHPVERDLKAGRFITTIYPEKETEKHIFLLHGGGFELEASMHCNVMMDLADRGFKVTAYDYPLAPEHQYKEINEAVYNAFKEFKTYYPDDKIALMGDSCGTSLSLTLMMRLRDEGDESRPKVAVWPSPAVDMAMDSPLMPIYEKNDPSLKLEVLYLCSERYAPERNWKDPLVSPYYAEDMSNLGDLFIYYSSVEVLRPDTEAFIKKVASFEGNTVKVHMCEGLFHDYVLQNELPESVYILDETAAFLNDRLD